MSASERSSPAQGRLHPLTQFVRYGLCGAVATMVDMGLFFLMAWKVFPALRSDELLVRLFRITVPVVEEAVRSRRYVLIKVFTFLVANFTAYVLNVLWVFESGRHSRRKEIALFYVVSITSWAAGTALGWALIQWAHTTTTSAYVANMVASVLINFVCRKYLVFKG